MTDLYISCFLYDKVNYLWSNLFFYLLYNIIYFIQFFFPRKTNVLCFLFSWPASPIGLLLRFFFFFNIVICWIHLCCFFFNFFFLETQLTTFLTSTWTPPRAGLQPVSSAVTLVSCTVSVPWSGPPRTHADTTPLYCTRLLRSAIVSVGTHPL